MALAWAAIAWAAGVALGPLARLPVHAWLIQCGAAAGFAFAFRRNPGYVRLFIALALLSLGAGRAQAAKPAAEPTSLTAFNDIPVLLEVRALVVEPPVLQGRTTRARVRAEAVRREGSNAWREVDGLIQAETAQAVTIRYGDLLLVTGWLATPANSPSFPERDYLEAQGIFSILRSVRVERVAEDRASPVMGWIYRVRARALEVFASSLPAEEAALVGGVVLGADESMPLPMKQVFARTGTTHILAVSGFNVALVAGTVTAVLGRWLGARRGAVAAAAAIGTYTLLVGAEPSAVRAAIMAGLALMAKRLGRQGDAIASLSATGMAMTAFRPSLLADIGFQLSFAATLGLVLVADPLEFIFLQVAGRTGRPPPRPLVALVREAVLMTLAAQAATLPLLAYHFGRVPLTALPANFLILPVQPALMSLGGLTALAGMAWAPAGQVLAWVTWPFAAFTLRTVEFAAGLPGASVSIGPVTVLGALASYAVIFGALVAWGRLQRKPVRFLPDVSPWVGVAALGVLAVFVWRQGLDAPDGQLHATLFSSGDVLIESPSGRFVLVRPPSPSILPAGDLGRRIPLAGSPLDWVVLPSRDSVQGYIAGRPSDRLIPNRVIFAGPAPSFAQLTGPKDLPDLQNSYQGLELDLGEGGRLEMLASTDRGAALLLTMGRARFLILAGLPFDSLPPAATVGVTAMVADSSASLSSVSAAQLGLWIAAAGGDAGPAPRQSASSLINVYTTSRYGWIELRTDGEGLWVDVERQGG